MSVVPKTVGGTTSNPPFPFEVISETERQSVDQEQSPPVLEQVSPSKARTLFVVAWIAAVAAAAGLIIFAALANPA